MAVTWLYSDIEAKLEFTPIRAPRGKMVHATMLSEPTKTACGKECAGWVVEPKRVNCHRCKAALVYNCNDD